MPDAPESTEGKARLASALSVTWGADRTNVASVVAIPPARRTERVLDAYGAPRYLDTREKREFFRWQRAWAHLRGLVAQVKDGAPAGLARAEFASAIGSLDVSSGKTTQAMQFRLQQTVREAPGFTRDPARIAYAGRVREEFRDFAIKVQEKALNYCVDAPVWDAVTLR